MMFYRNPLKCLSPAALFILFSCGGSQTEVKETPLPPPANQVVSNYSGPPPATDDVQNFKLSLWDNVATTDRCGACHVQGEQAPFFARNDDINEAYSAANGLVNFDSVQDSLLVSKVANGHNCWLTSDTACADIMTTWISNWASDQQAVATSIQLQAPPIKTPGANKNFPAEPDLFANTVYPLLEQFCADCHSNSSSIPISPYFGSSDVMEAYEAAKARLNLDNPAESRIVGRVRDEFHNCWSDCDSDAQALINAIQAMADDIEVTQLPDTFINSSALTLFDGTLASGGGRFESNLIAKWEFKTGSGNIAFDTSGIEPALDLTLSGEYSWVGGWGIQLGNGKAQGATRDSKKLRDLIVATGEFAIEAWIAPANVTQEGPARIVSYSGGRDRRNFTLGQTLYNYDALLRNDNTDSNGLPALSTADADEDLQAALQHVVFNYDQINGRRIYVNGQFTGDVDTAEPAGMADWDETFALVLGNEASGDMPWAGTIRMVAIHNRTLDDAQIARNFDVGIGQKFFLLFNISEQIDLPDSYIVFEASQFDSYSYLFTEPFFINLAGTPPPQDLSLQGMRLGINGRESSFGQVFATLDTRLSADNYDAETGQILSSQGTIIAVDKGPQQDEFFLTFDRLGQKEYVRIKASPPAPAAPVDLSPQAQVGVRDFAEINASMASLTTVPLTNSSVNDTYRALSQQLPSVTNLDGYLASHQMAVTQLSIKYCDQLVESEALRASFFPDFDFAQPADRAFDGAAREAVIMPIIERIIGNDIADQPDLTDITSELDQLIERLTQCDASRQCDTSYTSTVVKASCAAVLGSAAMLLQ
ncbi:LamG domain-containing protein [Aestuariibacter salexigens]|uniref:LamG domain-containing protein n=1 Tax=Aestuariibacter salexigens TaxID=226010 RepID=UPI000684611B|nr:LamG domain-containing protein [Aestuariibacter salexigens]